jgi:Mycoplasma protein of unknown function, DUF285
MFNQDLSEWNVQNVLQFSQMFASATHFNHSLCHWGEQILQHHVERSGVIVNLSGMFNATSCLNTSDPTYTTTTSSDGSSGPFCHSCVA